MNETDRRRVRLQHECDVSAAPARLLAVLCAAIFASALVDGLSPDVMLASALAAVRSVGAP